jgi:hypothetical protein
MVIIGLTFVGIVLLIGVALWSWNAWGSHARDRGESAHLRSGRQMVQPNTMKRGTDTD